MQPKLFGAAAFAIGLSLLAPDAKASLSTDLGDLVTQLQAVDANLTTAAFSPPETCLDLGSVSTSVQSYVAATELAYARLAPPTHPTTSDLDNLAQLSALSLDMAVKARLLATQMQSVEGAYDLVEVRSGLAAMLRLSNDIGAMSDRILEMADRILAMADNIGVMADRILLTQRIQSANIAATQAALLTTQQNMVTLTSSVSTIGYNVTLGLVKNDSLSLSQQLNVPLTSGNLASQLATVAVLANAGMSRSVALYSQVSLASKASSHYIDGDTLSLIDELGTLHASLAVALDAYARAILALAPVTDIAVLRDATATMLQLVKDIGTMSDRILEMKGKVMVMADNIGVMAGRIVATQDIQQANVLLTESSLRSAQSVTLSVIQTWGL